MDLENQVSAGVEELPLIIKANLRRSMQGLNGGLIEIRLWDPADIPLRIEPQGGYEVEMVNIETLTIIEVDRVVAVVTESASLHFCCISEIELEAGTVE